MEEVDKIIIQTLSSVGCSIDSSIKSIDQFDQDLFIESIATLLNAILNNAADNLPTKLPPNTGVKFRICSKFATVCQQIGYKNEIGYQTFLYSNSSEMRRLLIFLAEKLSKDQAQTETGETRTTGKSKSLKSQVTGRVKASLGQFWLPTSCKLNGLRIGENEKLEKESCKFTTELKTVPIFWPSSQQVGKNNKYAKDYELYAEKLAKLVTRQFLRRPNDLLTSALEINALNRLKEEETLLKSEISQTMNASTKADAINGLKNILKTNLSVLEDKSQSNCLTKSDLAEIENELDQIANKHLLVKGSRFTHTEKLQFTQDTENTVHVAGASEEKKEEEIQSRKSKFDELNKIFESLESDLTEINNTLAKVKTDIEQNSQSNKEIEEQIQVKKKMINLINDAPMNILRLKEEINNHEKKMLSLKNQWKSVQQPLEDEKSKYNDKIQSNKQLLGTRIEEMKTMRGEIELLSSDLTEKESLVQDLSKELDSQNKDHQTGKIVSNRQFYTRRILEIVASIDKQRKEIDKVLIETRSLQKEINQMTGKLERVFNSTDELIFKDAKKDEANKKVYKLFVSINESYDALIQAIENSSHINREIRDIEDQVNTEMQSKIGDNLVKLEKDYKQIKQENEQLLSQR